jgi:hypothetical protein
MAKRTILHLIDDLDGKPADETVQFGWAGTDYEIDLSAKNAAALEKALAKYVAAARPVAATGRIARPSSLAPTTDMGRKEYLAAVRAWAAENGYEARRGRIPAAVISAYESSR